MRNRSLGLADSSAARAGAAIPLPARAAAVAASIEFSRNSRRVCRVIRKSPYLAWGGNCRLSFLRRRFFLRRILVDNVGAAKSHLNQPGHSAKGFRIITLAE